jgi:hypothetical protein
MPHVKLSLKELREGGYLQEANRIFWHTVGLAMAVVYDDDSGEPTGVEFYDYRDDPEGVFFGPAASTEEAEERLAKARKIAAEINAKREARNAKCGSYTQDLDSLSLYFPRYRGQIAEERAAHPVSALELENAEANQPK